MDSQAAVAFAEQHWTDFLESLKTLVRIPSVSFDGFPPAEVRRSAQAVAAHLKESGLENVEILEVEGAHPYVYADWLHAKEKPTLLLYAHHDVQPPGRDDHWKTKPFEPVEKDGRLYGRGTADDKAGIVVHTSAILSYLRTAKALPVNVKLVIEGEEEIGSVHLEAFLKKYEKRLKADVMVLTDSGNYDTGVPTITTALRGIVALSVEVKTSNKPLHSGTWGGPGPDPVVALSKMIASLVAPDGRIAIPGIYDQVRPMTKVEEESLAILGYSDDEFRKQAGLLPGVQILGGKESALKKMSRIPSLAVNAIEASSRRSAANIINDSAWCKIGIRTVPDMDPVRTEKLLTDWLRAHAPWGVHVEIKADTHAPWWITTPEEPAFESAAKALSRGFGRQTVFIGQGGSIPFVGPFSQVLGGVPALLIGVEDPYTNAHAENESMHIGDFKKCVLSTIYYFELLGQE